jgi:hypothetical protein
MYYVYITELPRVIRTNLLKRSESVKRKSSVIYLKLLKLLVNLRKACLLNSAVRAGGNSIYRFAKINHIDADK